MSRRNCAAPSPPTATTRTTTSNTGRPTPTGAPHRSRPATTPARGRATVDVAPVTITGLQQGATYHFRIVATNSRGTTRSADRTFHTADAPAIRSFWSENVKATSAELKATINPQEGDTTYHFEYGTTVDYGTSVPVPRRGHRVRPARHDGHDPARQPDRGSTYHFRIVATNQYGTTISGDQTFNFFPPRCPNAQVRQETNSDHVPDCRAYEIASAGFARWHHALPGIRAQHRPGQEPGTARLRRRLRRDPGRRATRSTRWATSMSRPAATPAGRRNTSVSAPPRPRRWAARRKPA